MTSTIHGAIEATEPATLPQSVATQRTPTRDQFADVVRQLEELSEELRIAGEDLCNLTRRAKRMLGNE
jgi:hypothetical protein